MFKFLLLLLVSCPVMAMDGELSIGQTQFHHPVDGFWYQEPYAHDLQMNSPSAALGVTGYAVDHVRYHFGYQYLGKVTSSAQAVASDALYAKYGAGASKYVALGSWAGDGNVNMLYATIAPEMKFGDWTVAVEGGRTLYRASWTEQVSNYQTEIGRPIESNTFVHSAKWAIGSTFGASVGYKNVSVVLSWYNIGGGNDGTPPIYVGNAKNISVRYSF